MLGKISMKTTCSLPRACIVYRKKQWFWVFILVSGVHAEQRGSTIVCGTSGARLQLCAAVFCQVIAEEPVQAILIKRYVEQLICPTELRCHLQIKSPASKGSHPTSFARRAEKRNLGCYSKSAALLAWWCEALQSCLGPMPYKALCACNEML